VFIVTGFSFTGLKDGRKCTCGNSYAKAIALDDASCSTPCSGDAGQTCGGYANTQIYCTTGEMCCRQFKYFVQKIAFLR